MAAPFWTVADELVRDIGDGAAGPSIDVGTVFCRLIELCRSFHTASYGGYVLVDVKADNFMLATPESASATLKKNKQKKKKKKNPTAADSLSERIRVIDLALVDRAKTLLGNHAENAGTSDLVGTPLYASLRVHDLEKPSYRDDLFSVGLVVSELCIRMVARMSGTADGYERAKRPSYLPWALGESDDEVAAVKRLQVTDRGSEFYRRMPAEFADAMFWYLTTTNDLPFKTLPPYEDLLSSVSKLRVPYVVPAAAAAASASGRKKKAATKKKAPPPAAAAKRAGKPVPYTSAGAAAAAAKKATTASPAAAAAAAAKSSAAKRAGKPVPYTSAGTTAAAAKKATTASPAASAAAKSSAAKRAGKPVPYTSAGATAAAAAAKKARSTPSPTTTKRAPAGAKRPPAGTPTPRRSSRLKGDDVDEAMEDVTEEEEDEQSDDAMDVDFSYPVGAATTTNNDSNKPGILLIVTAGPDKGKSFLLEKGGKQTTVVVGRDPKPRGNQATFALDDPGLEDEHVKLEAQFGARAPSCSVVLTPLQKGGGNVFVDNTLVGKKKIAQRMSKIKIGSTVVVVTWQNPGPTGEKENVASRAV